MTGEPEQSAPAAEQASAAKGLTLTTPIQYAPGVGPRRAELFERVGVRTVADLIKHLPHRYEYEAGETPIGELPVGAVATARGTVVDCRWIPSRRAAMGRGGGPKGRFVASIEDRRHRLELVWFNAKYLHGKLHPGHRIVVTGKVGKYGDARQMANPKFRILETDADEHERPAADERYRPIYPATESLPSERIERTVEAVLPKALPRLRDHFDEAYRAERTLPELREAYRVLHQPADEEQVTGALRRLAYDELLFLQLGFAIKRKHNRTKLRAPALHWSESIDAHIRRRFPFELTRAQDAVAGQLAEDLQKDVPANRLLQGDVGSGKTVVALYALLLAVADRKQGALLAPTELLAEQHYFSIAGMLDGSNVRLALVTGSMTQGERAATLRKVERGEVDIVIGTHAMLGESVQFDDLAVVVVDEQHRFGVVQRAAMRSKSGGEDTVPHTIVMTATPIPRTLSLTIFGDLETSTITELPPGRQPIVTRVVGPEKRPQVYEYLADRLRNGEQAYIVVPAVEESDAGLKDVASHAKELERGPLARLRVATLHGRMKRLTRERIMKRFREGKIDALVATTVIEVGVDVPNASLMVVEHAERFGLAQLHQLRGRIGRGTRRSLCTFIGEPSTDDGRARLEAVAQTGDGFAIAEHDLQIRGMGEMLGTKQAGLPPLRVADLGKHMDLLRMAQRDAHHIAEADPTLSDPAHELLRKRLLAQYGEALGLADVA